MKGAGFCSLNREVHYIVWSLNRVLGVYCISIIFTEIFITGRHWYVSEYEYEVEPHYNIRSKRIQKHDSTYWLQDRILKINDANPTEDNRAFKCIAFLNDRVGNESRHLCSESSFFLRFQEGESEFFFVSRTSV